MTSASRRFRLGSALLAAALSGFAWTASASAQTEDCDRLRQAIAAAGRPDPQRSAQFVRAEQRQRAELARTQAYADQIGCSHGFLVFGGGGPPQCGAIENQIDRMTENLNALQSQIASFEAGDPDRQAALTEQFRQACSTMASAEALPDANVDGPNGFDTPDGDQGGPKRYAKAICVRTCDGGYFPLSFAPADRSTQGWQNLCSALCPNTEAKLYTTPDTSNVGDAVAIDGTAYTALPAAFKFQKTFDATCTCKPPDKSWVEALAGAEQLLDKSGKDVTVTSKMSDDMARPVAVSPGNPASTSAKRKFSKGDIKAVLDAQKAAEGAFGGPAPRPATPGVADDRALRPTIGAVRRAPGPDAMRQQLPPADEGF